MKPAANGPSRNEGGGGGSAPSSMGGGPGGLGGLFAGGMPKLRPAGERKPPGGMEYFYVRYLMFGRHSWTLEQKLHSQVLAN